MPAKKKTAVPARQLTVSPRPTSAKTDPGAGWERLAQVTLCVSFLVLPLFVGAWTPDSWEIHKLVILLIAVSLAWFAWFMAALRRGRMRWSWHLLDWPVIGLLIAQVIGTIISVRPWQSLVGVSGTLVDTLPATVGFISVYFLVAQLFRGKHEQTIVWASLLGGVGLTLVAQLFQFSKVSLLPGAWQHNQLFSTLANSPVQTGIMAAVVATVGLLLWAGAKERWTKLGLSLVVVVGWLVLLFLGQALAWAALAMGMMIVVWQQTRVRRAGGLNLILLAVGLAALGLIAQLTHVNKYADLPTPTEVNLDQATTWQTNWATLKDRPVLGSGPATWYQDFVRFRPVSFNANPYWNSRFVRAGNAWAQLMATEGVAGVGLWVAVLAFGLWLLWKRPPASHPLTTTTAMFLLAVFAVLGFFTTWSLLFMFLVWIGLGLARSTMAEPVEQPIGSALALAFAGTVIILVGFWYMAVRVYASQVVLQQAHSDIAATKSLSQVESRLTLALRLDHHNTDAAVLLANAYSVEAQLAITNNQTAQAQTFVTQALDQAQAAEAVSPKDPALYEAENNILNTLAASVSQAANRANRNFQTLRTLEPASPVQDVGYGQTLMVVRQQLLAQTATTTTPSEAAKDLQLVLNAYASALQKKPDYLQARYARALAYEAAQQYSLAETDMTAVLTSSPQVAQVWATQGRLLAKLQQLEQAKAAFEKALTYSTQDPSVYSDYAAALTEVNQKDAAKDVLNRGLKALPSDPTLTSQLSKLTP